MKISLRQLNYVIAASRHGSISKAAADMSISTSSILSAIDAFEQEFNIQLFVRRRSKGLTTTEAGQRAVSKTIQLLDEAAAYAEELRGSGPDLRGELRVGAFTSISPSIAPLVIRDLRVSYPELTVHLNEGDMMSIQHSLRDGSVDALITYDAGLWPEFSHETLANAPPHAVLAENDPLAEKTVISLSDLSDRSLLLLNLPQSRNYVRSLFEQAGVTSGPIQRLESFEMVRSAAAAELGVAILNIRPPYDTTYSGLSVTCRPLEETGNSPNIVLATRAGNRISRRTKAFADQCKRFFDTAEAQNLFVRKP
ncbi:MAG: LysR substrate-binding domain-containing protein [Roseovarius sp.]